MRTPLILLTACIKPNTSCSLALTDIEARAKQYQEAISWYFYHTDCLILFAENSGTKLILPKEIAGSRRFEYLCWEEKPETIDRGKGFKEALIIRKVINCSQLYQISDSIIKITGRLIVSNLPELLKGMPKDFNDWGFYGQFEHRFHRLDTRCMFIGKKLYPELLQFDSLINDNTEPHLIMEGAFALALTNQILQKNAKYHYPKQPFEYVGIGGGSGIVYTLPEFKIRKNRVLHALSYPLFCKLAQPLIVRNHKEWLVQIKQLMKK